MATQGHKGRRRSTRAEMQQLEQQIVDLLEAENPQTVRHAFYRICRLGQGDAHARGGGRADPDAGRVLICGVRDASLTGG